MQQPRCRRAGCGCSPAAAEKGRGEKQPPIAMDTGGPARSPPRMRQRGGGRPTRDQEREGAGSLPRKGRGLCPLAVAEVPALMLAVSPAALLSPSRQENMPGPSRRVGRFPTLQSAHGKATRCLGMLVLAPGCFTQPQLLQHAQHLLP